LKRKLLILDAVLIAAVFFAGVRMRDEWRTEKVREAAALNRKVIPAAAPRYDPLAQAAPALPSAYLDIAQKMLFDKSRNSTVVIETPAAPPPEPVPPLPVYHGQMDLGDGLIVMLSETSTAAHHGVRVGEEIGPFKLVDANAREMAFEWKGNVIRKSVDNLLDRSGAVPSAASGAAERSVQAAAPPPKPQKIDPNSSCNPNDGYGDGAVVDGYRKTVTPSPFGPICRWDAVRQ
jgi:hypothetical protein